jgi:hypothetical protein
MANLRDELGSGVRYGLLVLGAYAAIVGASRLTEMRMLAEHTAAYYFVSFIAGTVLAVASVALLRAGSAPVMAKVVAVMAIAALAANQITGLAWSSIICTTPS